MGDIVDSEVIVIGSSSIIDIPLVPKGPSPDASPLAAPKAFATASVIGSDFLALAASICSCVPYKIGPSFPKG